MQRLKRWLKLIDQDIDGLFRITDGNRKVKEVMVCSG